MTKRKWMDIGTIIVIVGIVLFMIFVRTVGKISSEKAHELVAAGAVLVDVRTQGEFSSGHIGEAVNIPVQNLEDRLSELPDKSKPIVVYCQSGARSGRAKRLLVQKGYTEVYDLGAMGRW